jgi:hypothetical protein
MGCVTHYGLAIYIAMYLKEGKRRIMETQLFHHAKLYLILPKKILLKRSEKSFKILSL